MEKRRCLYALTEARWRLRFAAAVDEREKQNTSQTHTITGQTGDIWKRVI